MRLVIADLACERGGQPVLDGVSAEIGPGEALLVTGRNGAGKSTLLRCIAGLVRPTRGRIALDGAERPRAALHYLGHRDGVRGSLTPRETLRFWAALLGGGGLPVRAALEKVGLGALADGPCAHLSAGQRRRLAVARLLVAPRRLWLLDEPTAALDADGDRMLAGLVAVHRAEGGLAVVASHAAFALDAPRRLALA
jgi:heme exporter protein A